MAIENKRVAVLVLSQPGFDLAASLCAADKKFVVYAYGAAATDAGAEKPARAKTYKEGGLPGVIFFFSVKDLVAELFNKVDGFVFIMAAGIAVRAVAGLLKSKKTDPGAVVVDENGDFAISLVGGHEGGANKLAYEVAAHLGAQPVITTGSEARKSLVVGIGCRRGAQAGDIVQAVEQSLERANKALSDVKCLATVDIKRDEPGISAAAELLNLPIVYIRADAIRQMSDGPTQSNASGRAFGLYGVSEPCALLARGKNRLILEKQVYTGITVAIAQSGQSNLIQPDNYYESERESL